jgi:hypothetical protein
MLQPNTIGKNAGFVLPISAAIVGGASTALVSVSRPQIVVVPSVPAATKTQEL